MALRDTLTGIQRGTFADTHGWMARLNCRPFSAVFGVCRRRCGTPAAKSSGCGQGVALQAGGAR